MAGSLPTVRGGFAALCPLTRVVSFATDVAVSQNASEQRFKRRPALTTFKLGYTRLSGSDLAALRGFYESQHGQFDSWSFTLGGTTFNSLVFTDSTFSFREDAATPTLYSVSLNCRQTKNPGQTAGAAGAAFPSLANGARSQLPYSQMRRFAVLLNDNGVSGTRYAFTPWYGGGWTGFPTRALRAWELAFPVVSDADLAVIEGHFRNNWGRWSNAPTGFSFTDPDDSTVYPKCRYDLDALEIVNNGPNLNSLTLRILETN